MRCLIRATARWSPFLSPGLRGAKPGGVHLPPAQGRFSQAPAIPSGFFEMTTSQLRGSAQKCLPLAAVGCRDGSDPTCSPWQGVRVPLRGRPGARAWLTRDVPGVRNAARLGSGAARAAVESGPSRAPAPPAPSPRLQPLAARGQGGARAEGLSPLRRHQTGQTERGVAQIAELCSHPLSQRFPGRAACPKAAPGSLRPALRSRERIRERSRGAPLARAPRGSRGTASRTLSPKGGTEYSGCEL